MELRLAENLGWSQAHGHGEYACRFVTPPEEEANSSAAPAHMLMRFGSGDISTKIASDEVQIGPLKVFMENGVLLMVIGLHGSFAF